MLRDDDGQRRAATVLAAVIVTTALLPVTLADPTRPLTGTGAGVQTCDEHGNEELSGGVYTPFAEIHTYHMEYRDPAEWHDGPGPEGPDCIGVEAIWKWCKAIIEENVT